MGKMGDRSFLGLFKIKKINVLMYKLLFYMFNGKYKNTEYNYRNGYNLL